MGAVAQALQHFLGLGTSALATHATRDDAVADAVTIWPVSWLELDIVTRQPLGCTDRFSAVGSVDIVGIDAVFYSAGKPLVLAIGRSYRQLGLMAASRARARVATGWGCLAAI